MNTSKISLRVAPESDQPGLSVGQKQFNRLVSQVETSRESLAQWRALALNYEQKLAGDYDPQLRLFQSRQADLVRALDEALSRVLGTKILTKSEQKAVKNIICDMAEHLLMDTGDETLEQIYNKHSDIEFAARQEAALEHIKANAAEIFGMAFDNDDDINSFEDITAQLQRQVEAERQRRSDEAAKHGAQSRTGKQAGKQTAKQKVAAAKLDAAETEASLSLREIYRKLVSALHPDREPDQAERARKTALMQRVNEAYKKRDLLQLLELQVAIMQIDERAMAAVSEDRLRHFNRILQEQCFQLQQDILQVQRPFREQLGLGLHQTLSPKMIMPRLLKVIAELKRNTAALDREIKASTNLYAFKRRAQDYKDELKTR
jgi:hypothetical protein